MNPSEVRRYSDISTRSWVALSGIVAYLAIVTADISHIDLLLDTYMRLPLLAIDVPLTNFGLFGPIILLVSFLGATIAYAQWNIAANQATNTDSDPLLLDLEPKDKVGGSTDARIDFLKVGMPTASVLVLLYIQLTFLPLHNHSLTATHQLLVCCATFAALYLSMGVDLARHPSVKMALIDCISGVSKSRSQCIKLSIGALTSFFSVFVATTPDSLIDSMLSKTYLSVSIPYKDLSSQNDEVIDIEENKSAGPWSLNRRAFFLTAWLLERSISRDTTYKHTWFNRNLVVTTHDFVRDRDYRMALNDDSFNQFSHNLRGRNLRYARLDLADLHLTDLTKADLRGAFLRWTDLRGASLLKANLVGADLFRANLDGANLHEARLHAARLRGASARGAFFLRASLQGADLSSSILDGSEMRKAYLHGADLRGASLRAVDFSKARIIGASLIVPSSKSPLWDGAYFRKARLWGTNFPTSNNENGTNAGLFVKARFFPTETSYVRKLIYRYGLINYAQRLSAGEIEAISCELRDDGNWGHSKGKAYENGADCELPEDVITAIKNADYEKFKIAIIKSYAGLMPPFSIKEVVNKMKPLFLTGDTDDQLVRKPIGIKKSNIKELADKFSRILCFDPTHKAFISARLVRIMSSWDNFTEAFSKEDKMVLQAALAERVNFIKSDKAVYCPAAQKLPIQLKAVLHLLYDSWRDEKAIAPEGTRPPIVSPKRSLKLGGSKGQMLKQLDGRGQIENRKPSSPRPGLDAAREQPRSKAEAMRRLEEALNREEARDRDSGQLMDK